MQWLSEKLGAPVEALWGHAAMLVFSALVAGSFSLGARVAPVIDPMALTWARFWAAAALIAGIIAVAGLWRREHLRAPWRHLILGGLFAFYFVTMFSALEVANPVALSAVFTLTPLMSAGFGWILLRQRTTPRMALALSLAAAGAVWVIFDADWAALLALRPGPGEAIFFIGCIAHAAYAPLVPKLRRGEPIPVLTLGTFIAGGLVLSLVGSDRIVATPWTGLGPMVWATLLYLVVFTGTITVMLVQFASLRLPSAKVLAYTYLIPVWVILYEAGVGQGLPPLGILAGVALVVAGLVLLLKEERGGVAP